MTTQPSTHGGEKRSKKELQGGMKGTYRQESVEKINSRGRARIGRENGNNYRGR